MRINRGDHIVSFLFTQARRRDTINLHAGHIEQAFEDMAALMELAKSDRFKDEDILTSEMYQQEGMGYADLGCLFDQAITLLSKAIDKDPLNKEAYFQRAIAYFETGSFDLALNDYLTSENNRGQA
jgi:tetratricopeptide (TPR) repeat protein